MSDAATTTAPSFSERVTRLLERVDFRRADTTDEREATFRLRYDAYLREGAIGPNPSRRFTDPFDDKPNTWIFNVYIDETLASSMRLNITIPGCTELPALQVFADILNPQIAAGKIIVDPTRFVTDRALSRQYPELPYVTLRLVWTALEYFQADIMLATVRGEHQAFYKRLWGAKPLCPPRPYPTLSKPIACMTLDYKEARDRVQARYPFFQSTFFERRMLFERYIRVGQRSAAA